MAALAAGRAFVIKNASLTVASNEFNNAVWKAQLTPDTPITTQRTLVPDGVIVDVDDTAWTLELTGIADWAADGLADVFYENNGLQVDCTLTPKAGGRSATFTIVAVPVQFGGEGGSLNQADMSFGVVGQPVFSDAESGS